ncbi:iron-containing alcohol dehydrogenase [Vreelandella janggokensis]|uniref:iron-containing alcohol dehydrogenase n=1 Tax=Vreelandella janggokensis TaxID=370767 RepID=UPI0028571150|nr:iron-containing alcohol dehydrogenase [Halomonas janggokensis]MDR5886424.1 iron-containing alcohol dehydrogenase [Halomonas janggokensis]
MITGHGAAQQLQTSVQSLGIQRPLIVTDSGVVASGILELITEQLVSLNVTYEVFDQVTPEPEVEIVEICTHAFNAGHYDGVIALGGGSAMDIAKCVAVYAHYDGPLEELFGENKVDQREVPLIAMPTTAGTGSEVTNIAILSDKSQQMKKGIVSDCLLSDVAIVAPELTLSCPRSVTAASGVDALVHAVEAYLSNFATPITDALAVKAMNMIIYALPKAFANPNHLQAREDMATGSLLAGLAFGNAGVGAVHALAYPLGGRYYLAHGVTNALLLPFVMEWNKLACLKRFRGIAVAFEEPVAGLSDDAVADAVIKRMHKLCTDMAIPSGLRSFDIPESAIPELAAEAINVERLLRNNPRVLTQSDIEAIYRAAY